MLTILQRKAEEFEKLSRAASATTAVADESSVSTATDDESSDDTKPPEFTQEQIDEMLETISSIPQFIKVRILQYTALYL